MEVLNYKSLLNDEESDTIDKIKNIILQFKDDSAYSLVDNLNNIEVLLTTDSVGAFGARVLFGALIYTLEDLVGVNNIYRIESTTSIDLLFIVDITGSMTSFLSAIKRDIIKIVDGIIEKCPGININLGFIGYRDFYEGYYD